MVDRDRRHPTPVVNAGCDEARVPLAREVRRRLEVHRRAEDHPRCGHRGQELLDVGFGCEPHRRVGLRPEVLDDDLLDVPVLQVQGADRKQGLDPLLASLPDSDQDTRGERDRQATRVLDGLEPHGRHLVRGTVVGHALLAQAVTRRLQHHTHRGAHLLEPGHVLPGHRPGVDVRQQAGLLDHPDGDGPEVVQRTAVSARLQPLPGNRVALLRLLAEREERLLAAGLPPGLGDGDHLVRRQEGRLRLGRGLRERAVVADVAAQLRQRDEHLAGVRHGVAVALVAKTTAESQQSFEVLVAGGDQRSRFGDRDGLAVLCTGERASYLASVTGDGVVSMVALYNVFTRSTTH